MFEGLAVESLHSATFYTGNSVNKLIWQNGCWQRKQRSTLRECGKPIYTPSPHVTLLVFRKEIQIANECKKNVLNLIKEPIRCTNSQIYFWNKTLHVSECFSVHHQEFFTVHTTVGTCHGGFANCLLASCQQTCMTYTYCCVYSARILMMDEETL